MIPADGCTNCVTEDDSAAVPAYYVEIDVETGQVRAWYYCPRCDRDWPVSYLLSALAETTDPAAGYPAAS
jgi:hypothetical protein